VRYRQRINHKFSIYPLKFGEVLCTGCGRCTRVCHAGQDLVEILAAIDIAARRPGQVAAASAAADVETAS
jgi:ferredoxin